MLNSNKSKIQAVRIDPTLDKYEKVVLFPEKLREANKKIENSGFPIITGKNAKH